MGVIDFHTHAFPNRLARRAMRTLARQADWQPVLDGRLKSLIRSMDAADIDVSVVCAIATKPEQAADIFKWCRKIRSDRIEPFPSVHPDTDDLTGWMKRFADAGFAGIKVHPMYQDFAADEPRGLRLLSAAAEAGLAVQMHCGRDISFPADDDRASPARVRRALEAVGEIKLICTHMGGWRMWDAAAEKLLGARCHVETSFTSFEVPAERLVEMIRAHGVDRVMFGTDSPWTDQSEQLAQIRGLGLTDEELSKILFANAARLLRL